MAAVNELQKRSFDSENTESKETKRFCGEKCTEIEVEAINNTAKNQDSSTKATEEDVGITEYVSKLSGFYAVMKERYSDFLVNEIDIQGNIVRLTNMDKPVISENTCQVKEILDEDTVKKLQDLVNTDECHEVIIEVTNKEKNVRKEIHVAIRQNFQGLESSTEEREERKVIVVKKLDSKAKGKRFKPSTLGNYIHFVLYKENKDTMDTINTISSFLRVQPKVFSYAGSKDRRGKTSQLVSAYRLAPEKLLSVNKRFNMIKVGNIVYKNDQMKLGDLLGNSFVIILRQVEGDTKTVEQAVESLSSKGFINYYGMQRFGTSSISTHSIGRALLMGNWKTAINLILKPRLEGDENLSESRRIWQETNDARKALENLRHKSSIEGKLLQGLASSEENNLVNALNAIPRNTRLMYIHSYQSFIWNQVVSRRIKKYGLNVLKGDLISKVPNEFLDDESEAMRSENPKKHALSSMVKFVSDEDINRLTINDILMPLPGHSVVYPNNETKDWYEDCLKSDGMSWNNFESKVKTYSLSGAYRKVIITPTDVKWELLPYDDVSKPLALSDLDVLQGVTLCDPPINGSLKALKLELKLPSSSYATMAVREVLKCDCYLSKKKSNE
ncbi:pseudouridylate synthase 7 homolog isoform X2 [Stegodyphus dumicola]|uniref:pseudouridylate synthase 7 homolog isoform X2 n=1 Tax=Stegodyphus dumicola TaxID=202533 RepID=UPI0015B0787C|nr:pseudouridylate synthase 7 homolog isoform X2 [Stegodyphus dumicola]